MANVFNVLLYSLLIKLLKVFRLKQLQNSTEKLTYSMEL